MTTNAQRYFKVKGLDQPSNKYYGNPHRIEDESLLPQITLETLGFTRQSVKDQLIGLGRDLIDPDTGKPYTDQLYDDLIAQAVANTEKEFDIVIRPRINQEKQDFNRADFTSYMKLQTQERPIIQVDELVMQFNNQPLMKFQDSWLKVYHRYGQIEVNPDMLLNMTGGLSNLGMMTTVASTGIPLLGSQAGVMGNYGSQEFAPQMLGITYVAGMLPPSPADRGINREWYVHPDLIAYVAKKATIEVLERWGRLILGAGIAGYNIAVDGISTGVQSTQSAENTGSTADIKLLQADMKDIHDNLAAYYGYNMGLIS